MSVTLKNRGSLGTRLLDTQFIASVHNSIKKVNFAYDVRKVFFPLRFQKVDGLWSLEENLSPSKGYQLIKMVGGYDLLSGLFSRKSMSRP